MKTSRAKMQTSHIYGFVPAGDADVCAPGPVSSSCLERRINLACLSDRQPVNQSTKSLEPTSVVPFAATLCGGQRQTNTINSSSPTIPLLLLEPRLPDVGTAELDVEHPLHGRQHLLVGGRRAALEVGDDGGRGVALGGQLALRQRLGLELCTRLHDGVADLLAHRLGLDDVVRPVDLCEALAFYAGLDGLLSHACQYEEGWRCGESVK